MRQVNRDELVYMISSALREAPASLVRGMLDSRADKSGRDRTIVAQRIVDTALKRYEVLAAKDLSPILGEQAFSIPVARLLGEEPSPLIYEDD